MQHRYNPQVLESYKYQQSMQHARGTGNSIKTTYFIFSHVMLFVVACLISSFGFTHRVNLSCYIIIFLLYCSLSSWWVGFKFHHPLVWFSWPFTFYSISTPLLSLLDAHYLTSSLSEQAFEEACLLQLCALLCVTLAVGYRIKPFHLAVDKRVPTLLSGAYPFFLICIIGSMGFLYSWYSLGLVSKMDKYFASSFLHIDFFYTLLLLTMTVYTVSHYALNKSFKKIPVLLYIGYLILSFLISGSREVILRFLFVYIALFSILFPRVKGWMVGLVSLGVVYLSTVLGSFKNYLLSYERIGEGEAISSIRDILVTMFSSEFRTASENLIILVDNIPSHFPFFYGTITYWEVALAMRIGVLSDRMPMENAATWFTQAFFPGFADIGVGSGFTMVGQGYADFGWIGVIALYTLFGIFLRKLYIWAADGAVQTIVYVNLIPICVYCTRQSIAPLLSQSAKHVILPLIVMYAIGSIVTVGRRTLSRQLTR